MKYKDERLKLLNDMLNGIKVLKLYAWEESMLKMVSEIRDREMKTLRIIYFLTDFINVSFQIGPLLVELIY